MTPPRFLKTLIFLEDLDMGKEELKKLNALEAKAFVAVKSKLKKFVGEYASKLAEFRKVI